MRLKTPRPNCDQYSVQGDRYLWNKDWRRLNALIFFHLRNLTSRLKHWFFQWLVIVFFQLQKEFLLHHFLLEILPRHLHLDKKFLNISILQVILKFWNSSYVMKSTFSPSVFSRSPFNSSSLSSPASTSLTLDSFFLKNDGSWMDLMLSRKLGFLSLVVLVCFLSSGFSWNIEKQVWMNSDNFRPIWTGLFAYLRLFSL